MGSGEDGYGGWERASVLSKEEWVVIGRERDRRKGRKARVPEEMRVGLRSRTRGWRDSPVGLATIKEEVGQSPPARINLCERYKTKLTALLTERGRRAKTMDMPARQLLYPASTASGSLLSLTYWGI